MPTCLDCGIRVPSIEDWDRVNGRRVKPCMCGAPKESIKAALREQNMRAYRATIRRIAMSPLPSRLIVRNAMEGQCDLTYMGICALESQYGQQWRSGTRSLIRVSGRESARMSSLNSAARRLT